MKKVNIKIEFDTVVPDHIAAKITTAAGGKRDQIQLVEYAFMNAGTEFTIEAEVIPDKHVDRLY